MPLGSSLSVSEREASASTEGVGEEAADETGKTQEQPKTEQENGETIKRREGESERQIDKSENGMSFHFKEEGWR